MKEGSWDAKGDLETRIWWILQSTPSCLIATIISLHLLFGAVIGELCMEALRRHLLNWDQPSGLFEVVTLSESCCLVVQFVRSFKRNRTRHPHLCLTWLQSEGGPCIYLHRTGLSRSSLCEIYKWERPKGVAMFVYMLHNESCTFQSCSKPNSHSISEMF